MEERKETDDIFDEVMLPGFRFHPTDEELVGFYLLRKIQQKPLSIELIKQIDIYKYDPWDLPKLATNGEKEWYFFCPRDRKYRNSTRPNRVTGAGFWKATGTDRPIYSSENGKCIGLKKSLVFYTGKAAKGIKTDWMMHEFRLPSLSSSISPITKNIPINEALALCRIFKKPNSSTKRALSHSWVSPSLNTTKFDIINTVSNIPISCSSLTMANKINSSSLQFGFCNDIENSSFTSFSPQYLPLCGPTHHMDNTMAASGNDDHSKPTCTFEASTPASRCVVNDATSMLLDMSTSILGDFAVNMDSVNSFADVLMPPENLQRNLEHGEAEAAVSVKGQNVGEMDDEWGSMVRSSMEFPYSFPPNLMWGSSSPSPSDLSTSYSTNCYT